jgi:hypothetical protein
VGRRPTNIADKLDGRVSATKVDVAADRLAVTPRADDVIVTRAAARRLGSGRDATDRRLSCGHEDAPRVGAGRAEGLGD